MALSDCSECWKTPCVCGKAYEHYSIKELSFLIASMLQLKCQDEASKILKSAEEQLKKLHEN